MADVLSNKVYNSIQPYTPVVESTGTILYANQFADVPQVEMPDDIRALLDSDVGLVGPNIIIQLEQKFKHFRNGPWYVDSRDGILYIHNRKFHEEPVHTYVYYNEPGEVISVKLNTQYVTKSTKIVLHETIDPVNKQVESQITEVDDVDIEPTEDSPLLLNDATASSVGRSPNSSVHGSHTTSSSGWSNNSSFVSDESGSYAYANTSTYNPDKVTVKVASDPSKVSPSKEAATKAYLEGLSTSELRAKINNVIGSASIPENNRKALEQIMSGLNNIQDKETFESLLHQLTDKITYQADNDSSLYYYTTSSAEYVSAEGSYEGGFSNRRGEVVGTKNGATIYKVTGLEIPLYKLYTSLMSRYGGTEKYLWAANANANGGLKNKEKVVTMTMTVVGRPSLQTSMVINVQNIGQRWSGPWYVKKCTHKMDPNNGYLCELELVQNKSRVGQSTTRNGWSTQNVLHVYTTKNGTTSYSMKPESDQSNFTMDAYNKTDFEWYEGKYGTVADSGSLTEGETKTLKRDMAINQLYYEKNAGSPSLQAVGMYDNTMTYSESYGDITTLHVKRKSPTEINVTESEIVEKMSGFKNPDFASIIIETINKTRKSIAENEGGD